MLKNKSIDYIFGMISGISISITFWACTNTDLIASNDTTNNSAQQVKITNWDEMPSVRISSLGNTVDCVISGTPTVKLDSNVLTGNLDVNVMNEPTVKISSSDNTVKLSSIGNRVDVIDMPFGCCQ